MNGWILSLGELAAALIFLLGWSALAALIGLATVFAVDEGEDN